jgi:2,4-dienoyl-CoA reductase-like NADH-dependent reductase (Old Yellow Enzyme family)
MLKAVILIRDDDLADVARCTAFCQTQNYHIEGLIRDGDWNAAVSMIHEGLADIIVMARPDHFDPDWKPRVEFVSEARPRHQPNSGRRTRFIRRSAAG